MYVAVTIGWFVASAGFLIFGVTKIVIIKLNGIKDIAKSSYGTKPSLNEALVKLGISNRVTIAYKTKGWRIQMHSEISNHDIILDHIPTDRKAYNDVHGWDMSSSNMLINNKITAVAESVVIIPMKKVIG